MSLKTSNCLFIIGLLVFPCTSFAQQESNLREKKIVISDTVVIDTLSIIPNTVKITLLKREILDSSYYQMDYAKGLIFFDKKRLKERKPRADSVSISYRVFPFSLSKETKHKDIANIRPDLNGTPNPFSYKTQKVGNDDIFQTGGINKSGSISRGVSFGNNQDVAVNSNLNLQLSGKLDNNIDLLMVATDNNIPIQPDGNTQQLQQFDKVFIQLSDSRSKLIAGDFELKRPNSYFMNYNEKAQGLNVSSLFNIPESTKSGINKIMFSGAVSKGKFGSNQIEGIEQNQGPYVLTGNENEPHIIILSGTEKVYIDGKLLQRGQENDYTIDYNVGEIRFTPKNLITKDTRIYVEFQYTDNSYTRSLVQLSDEYEQDKLKLRFNLYSEQDAKNQPLEQQLTPGQKLLLASVGDSVQRATTPSIDSVPFSNNLVLYMKKDTLTPSGLFLIYQYSTDSTKAHFNLSFSNVGQGNGNYKQINANANGKVYQWVAPVGGIKQGAYEPVILLIAPQKKQMLTMGGDYLLSPNSKLSLETAISNNDVNTFANVGKADDVGYALKLNFDNVKKLTHPDTSINKKEIPWTLNTNINYEFQQKDFSAIEQFRSIEFNRDWNRLNVPIVDDQNLLGANLSLVQKSICSLAYHFNAFLEGSNYNGFKNGVTANYNKNGYSFLLDGSALNSQTMISNTDFLRSKASLSKKIKWIKLGVDEEQEKNEFRSRNAADSLQRTSYEFYQWEVFAKSADTSKNIGISYKQRTDYGALQNKLVKSTFAENLSLTGDLLKKHNSRLSGSITYRTLKLLDSLVTTQKPDNALLGRLEYNTTAFKGLIVSTTYYEIGSGLEEKKDITYVQVPAGQGVYTWVDYNHDGIQQLNEFEIAPFKDEADYIIVYTPSTDYIKTYTNQFSEALNIKPAAIWANKGGWRKFISKFSDQTAYRTDRKTTNDDLLIAYNPFLQQTRDTSLVSLNSSFRNTLYFNQLNPIFGTELSYQDINSKTLLTYGNDTRTNAFIESKTRLKMSSKFSLNLDYKNGQKYTDFSTTNFLINYYELQPQINYQLNTSLRFSLSFRYAEKQNEYGFQNAQLQDYGAELKYTILKKGNLNFKANFIQAKYNDTDDSPVAFEMLEGLKTGQNVTWNIVYQRNLANNMQVSLTYDGRISEGNKTINTGGAQVRAFF